LAVQRNAKYPRDYSVTGPECGLAKEQGLANGEFYTCPIPRQRLRELMKRKNGPGIIHTLTWFALLAASGYVAYLSWGTWWAIPAFMLYGTLYVVPATAAWHETSHGTVFRSSWMNEVLYQITSFMTMASATQYRWGHVRHHTDTHIVGCDPETSRRPPVMVGLLLNIFRLYWTPGTFKRYFLHCLGKVDKEEAVYVPSSEHRKMFLEARISVAIYLSIIGMCIYMESILPAMFVGLPVFYGWFLNVPLMVSQHHGLHEDVLDHRLNTRTFYTNPVLRFLYWNMNYHIEHHMFPMIPYHALPKLHQEIKWDCPEPNRGLFSAVKESLSAMTKQLKDPSYSITRPLPATARPYKFKAN